MDVFSFCDPLDERCDSCAEGRVYVFDVESRILDCIVEESGSHHLGVTRETELAGEEDGDSNRVDDERLTRISTLTFVTGEGDVIRLTDDRARLRRNPC